ncbi:MAG TPA: glycoside hydrolase family 3 C-terminal domain-containing protein [Lachnospiraceae bacterium]|nr:glycoside hydrolase family 3 C-terminal domain-containing protein [Lachnospiraceae bacterium]
MTREEAKQKSVELINKMSIEEMASQLKYDSPAIDRLNIPEYNWWNEGLHGVARAGTATVFPQAIGLGATFDVELLNDIAKVIATEGRAKYNESSKMGDRDIYKGLTYWSPNVNIFRDPRWGRGHETYGEDPYLTGVLGTSFIKGLQGEEDGIPYMKLAACAKHFAVHSGPEGMRHYFDAKVSLKDLWETYLPAFETCVIDGKVEAVMGAYNRTNGEACCAHEVLMNDILRGKWSFEGHYVSDCWAIRDFHEYHMITKTPEQSAALALKMGCDLNCGCTYQHISKALKKGYVSIDMIKTSAIRLFTTRYLLGMFESTPYDDIPYEVVECKKHLEVADKASKESLVLLKNDGILPINKSKIQTIGVIGPNANSRNSLIGNYHGTSSRYITVLEGIQDIAGDDMNVLYSEGSHLYLEKGDFLSKSNHRLSEAVTVANHSDLVVLCLGLDETLEGEQGDTGNADASGDKKDLRLPLSQRNLLDAIISTGKPFVVCMMSGSAMDLQLADEKANAIIQAWYPGARGGKCVAEALFGVFSPSGKLPITLYYDLEGFPEFTDYAMKGRTYRYLEKAPLYPFGYGLTYGKAKVASVEYAKDSAVNYSGATQNGLQLIATLHNISKVDIGEVVQVYVKVLGSKNEVLNQRLCAFKRVFLKAGETQVIELNIPQKAFMLIDEYGNSVCDGSNASLSIGFGQPDERTESLTGEKAVVLHI